MCIRDSLTEFFFDAPTEYMDNMLDEIRSIGFIPIVAHPERYGAVQEDTTVLAGWFGKGYIIPVSYTHLIVTRLHSGRIKYFYHFFHILSDKIRCAALSEKIGNLPVKLFFCFGESAEIHCALVDFLKLKMICARFGQRIRRTRCERQRAFFGETPLVSRKMCIRDSMYTAQS